MISASPGAVQRSWSPDCRKTPAGNLLRYCWN